jgi:hypothetical protein
VCVSVAVEEGSVCLVTLVVVTVLTDQCAPGPPHPEAVVAVPLQDN